MSAPACSVHERIFLVMAALGVRFESDAPMTATVRGWNKVSRSRWRGSMGRPDTSHLTAAERDTGVRLGGGFARRRVWRGQTPAMDSTELNLDTSGRRLADLTEDVARFCHGKGDGLLHLFAPHATAGLALMELGSGSEADLDELLERVLPRDDRYRHRHGSRGHRAH